MPFPEVGMGRSVVVVGGGIGGLAIAWELLTRPGRLPAGVDVEVLEAASRAGGTFAPSAATATSASGGRPGFSTTPRRLSTPATASGWVGG